MPRPHTTRAYTPLRGSESQQPEARPQGVAVVGRDDLQTTGSAADIEAGQQSTIHAASGALSPRQCSHEAEEERRRWDLFAQLRGKSVLDVIRLEDFAQLLQQRSGQQRLRLDQAELEAAFREMDANSDEQVTFKEFDRWWGVAEAAAEAQAAQPAEQQTPSVRLFRHVSTGGSPASTLDDGVSLPEGVVAAGFDAWATAADFEFEALLPDTAGGEEQGNVQDKEHEHEHEETPTGPTATAKLQQQLEDLQVTTVSGLVERAYIDIAGQSVEKKLLFLNVKQARKFDISSLPKVLTAMDIPSPKLVITIFGSGLHGVQMKSWLSLGHVSQPETTIISSHTHSETTEWELLNSLRRLEAFMEDIVLPIAVQTRALVIVSETTCHMAFAFSNACLHYSKAHGGNLPFTVMTFASKHSMIIAQSTPGTTCYALKECSVRPGGWKEDEAKHPVVGPDHQNSNIELPHDLCKGCTHYVMVGGHGDSAGAATDLRAAFVQRLANDLPSIALGTFCGNLTDMSDYLLRDMAVLALDSRPPPRQGAKYANNFADMRHDMLELETKLVAAGCTDSYTYSQLAHLNSVLQRVVEQDEKFSREQDSSDRDGQPHTTDGDVDGDNVPDVKPIHVVIEDNARLERAQRDGQGESSDANGAPTKDERASEGLEVLDMMNSLRAKVWASWKLQLVKRIERSLTEVEEEDRQLGIAGLNEWLKQLTITCMRNFPMTEFGCSDIKTPWTQIGNKSNAVLDAHNIHNGGFLKRMRGMHQDHLYCFVPQVAEEEMEAKSDFPVPTVAQMKQQLLGMVRSWKGEFEKTIENNGAAATLSNDDHLRRRNMLLSSKLYTGNLCDKKRLEQIMQQVTMSSRLPEHNSIEATRILLQAWDSVDLFVAEARRSKIMAKTSYFLLLLIGVAAIVMTTTSINRPDIIGKDLRGALVIAFSLAGTAIASATTYLNPAQRWTQLQGAALGLESECWKFRTRSGIYTLATASSSGGAFSSSEEALRQVLESVRQHVAKSAAVSETAFGSTVELFSRPPKRRLTMYQHGQYRGCGLRGTFGHAAQVAAEMKDEVDQVFDDHHSPVPPETYLRLRVEPMVRFYQSRLPSYYRWRTTYEVILVLGSLSGTLMAFLHVDEWVAVVAALTAMVTAWSAFSGTDSKLSRYSGTIEKVQTIMLWWRSLSQTDKALPANIHQLVTSCEEVFERERESWGSTSMATSLLTQAASNATADEEAEDSENNNKKKKKA